jgi:hypothetical protein
VLVKLLRTPLDAVYLWLCAPLVLALVYILPPFQAPDEAAHFYRAIQISHGEMAPVVAPKTYRHPVSLIDTAGCRTGAVSYRRDPHSAT